MKRIKKIKQFAITAALAFGLLFSAACGKTPPESASDSPSSVPEESSSPTELTIELAFYQKEIVIETNRTLLLQYRLEGSTETPVFTSSAENVVRVSEEGRIETLAAGTAVITAKLGDAEASCTIVVTETVDYPRLLLSRTSAELAAGGSVRVVPDVYFRGEKVEAEIRYASSAESVATVDENGRITAVGAGAATVYVTAEWQGIVLTETVAVIVKAV